MGEGEGKQALLQLQADDAAEVGAGEEVGDEEQGGGGGVTGKAYLHGIGGIQAPS